MPKPEFHDSGSDPKPTQATPRSPGKLIVAIMAVESLLLAGAVAAFVTNNLPVALFLPIVIVLGLIGAALVIWLAVQNEFARIGALTEALRDTGLTVEPKPDGARKKAVFKQAGAPRGTPFKYPHQIIWVGVSTQDAREITVCEVRTQQSDSEKGPRRAHNYIAAHAACPISWPTFVIRPAASGLLSGLFNKSDLAVESEVFNARWRVACKDPGRDDPMTEFEPEAFALMVLTPQIQGFLLDGERDEHWHIGDGGVTLVQSLTAAIETDDVTGAIHRLHGFLAALDPDIAAQIGARGDRAF